MIFQDGFKLVRDFREVLPTPAEIDSHIADAKSRPGIEVVELVIHPIWTAMLLDDVLLPLDFKRVGSITVNCVTLLRWQKTLRQAQATEEDQRLAKMRAGLQDLVK
jgi:hypothetical protein